MDNFPPEIARSVRLASALMAHQARGDGQGIAAIMGELQDREAVAEVLLATLGLAQYNMTANGLSLNEERMTRLTAAMLRDEEADPEPASPASDPTAEGWRPVLDLRQHDQPWTVRQHGDHLILTATHPDRGSVALSLTSDQAEQLATALNAPTRP